jgi:hypothetical protein
LTGVLVKIAVLFHIYGMEERIKEQAAARGHSVRQLVPAGLKGVVQNKRARRKRMRFPLITTERLKVEVTNEPIYEHVEFP